MGFLHKKSFLSRFPFPVKTASQREAFIHSLTAVTMREFIGLRRVHWPVLQEEVEDVIEKVTLNLIPPLLSGSVWNSLGGFEPGPGLNPCTLIYLGRVGR